MNLLLPEIDWASLKDLALFALAIYAALLSTINWRRAQNNEELEEFRGSKIIVSAGSLLVFRGPAYAQVTAVNAGNDPVTVMLLTFEAPGGARLKLFDQGEAPGKPDTTLPVTLNEGQSAKMTVPYRDIAQALHNNDQVGVVNVTPICVDTTGAVYRGEPWEVNITQFALM